jgi:hypothetical protein
MPIDVRVSLYFFPLKLNYSARRQPVDRRLPPAPELTEIFFRCALSHLNRAIAAAKHGHLISTHAHCLIMSRIVNVVEEMQARYIS